MGIIERIKKNRDNKNGVENYSKKINHLNDCTGKGPVDYEYAYDFVLRELKELDKQIEDFNSKVCQDEFNSSAFDNMIDSIYERAILELEREQENHKQVCISLAINLDVNFDEIEREIKALEKQLTENEKELAKYE